MRLGIFTGAAKDIDHFGLVIREVIFINLKLVPQLKLLIVKYMVSPICK